MDEAQRIHIQEDKPSVEVKSGGENGSVVVVVPQKQGDGSDSGHRSSPEKGESDEDQVLLSSLKEPRDDGLSMQGVSNVAFVDDEVEGKGKASNGLKKVNGEVAQQRIFIPEDALLNHHSGQVRVRKKRKKGEDEEEKVPMSELKSVVIPLNGVSEKELQKDGDKLAKKPLDEYLIPANTHTKFLRREKLYLTKDKNSLCCGRKRFFVFCAVTLIFAIAVLVGVLAATGILQADSGSEHWRTGSQLPHPASMSQSMSPQPTHQLPLTTQHPNTQRRTPQSTTFLNILPQRFTTTSQKFTIVTSVPTTVPSTIVKGQFTILNKNFSDSLLHNTSRDFRALASELESKLQEIFRNNEGFVSVKILQFKEGSIVVKYVTVWNKMEDIEMLDHLFVEHVQANNGYLGNYLIKSKDNYSSPTPIDSTTTSITRVNDKEGNSTTTTITNKKEDDQTVPTTQKETTAVTVKAGTDTTIMTTTKMQVPNATESEMEHNTFTENISTMHDAMITTKMNERPTQDLTTTVSPSEYPEYFTSSSEDNTGVSNVTIDVTSETIKDTEKSTVNYENTIKVDNATVENPVETTHYTTEDKNHDASTEVLPVTTNKSPELVTESTVTTLIISTSTEYTEVTKNQGNITLFSTKDTEGSEPTLVTELSTVTDGTTLSQQPTITDEKAKTSLENFSLTTDNEQFTSTMETSTENLSLTQTESEAKIKPFNITKRPKVVDYESTYTSYTNESIIDVSTVMENLTTGQSTPKEESITDVSTNYTTQLPYVNETTESVTDNAGVTELLINATEILTTTSTDARITTDDANNENSNATMAVTEVNTQTETSKENFTETIQNDENLTSSNNQDMPTETTSAISFENIRTTTAESDNVPEYTSTSNDLEYTQIPNITKEEDNSPTSSFPETTTTMEISEEPTVTDTSDILLFQTNRTVEPINNDDSTTSSLESSDDNTPSVILNVNGTQLHNETSEIPFFGNITSEIETDLNETDADMMNDYNITSFFNNSMDSTMLLAENNVTMSEVDSTTFSDLDNESLVMDEHNGTIFHSSDASNGSSVEGCSVDHFMCPGDLECRPLLQKCDGVQDCPDGFDESTCEEDCGLNFRCDNETVCIKDSAKCDGVYDCENGTDEYGCSPTECGQHLVQCLDKSACIKPLNICDGHYNCHDKSDERDCVDRSTCMSTGRFYCSDGLCLPPGLHCDGSKDCSKGEDEENCTCPDNWFQCSDGKCIEAIYRCDGEQNCTDGSDEMECVRVDANNVVEVYNSATNSWAIMCEEKWTYEDGNELCHELGFSSADSVSYVYIFNNGSSWSTIANSTDQRNTSFWIGKSRFTNNCSSSKAATVTCTNYECGEIKGQNRFLEQWPIMVMIHSLGLQKSCRADIVTPLWLITSAECIQKMPQNVSEWFVQVEQIDLITSEVVSNSTQVRDVKLTVMHPHSSKFRSPILHDFDMALVRLKESLDFKNLAAICLPEAEVKPGITCFTGSATVNQLQGTSVPQMPISFLALTIQSRDSCNNPEHYNGWVSSRMLCTESSDANKKLCNNDEAAPLTCYAINRKWYLAGILTYQRNCGTYHQQPAIYANIFSMRKYIEKVIGMNQYNLTYDTMIYTIQDETTLLPNVTEELEPNTTIPMYWPDVSLSNVTDNETYISDSEFEANNSLLQSGNEDIKNEFIVKEQNDTLLFQSFKSEENETLINKLIGESFLNNTDEAMTVASENNNLKAEDNSSHNLNKIYQPIPSPMKLSMDENLPVDATTELGNTSSKTENNELNDNTTESAPLDNTSTTSILMENDNVLKNNTQNDSLPFINGTENTFEEMSDTSEKPEVVTTNEPTESSIEHEINPEVIYNSTQTTSGNEEKTEQVLDAGQNLTSMLMKMSGGSNQLVRLASTLLTQKNSSTSDKIIPGSDTPRTDQNLNSYSEDGKFQCMEGHQTINTKDICNGIHDCKDESDEWNCVRMNSSNNIVEVRHHSGEWFPVCSGQWNRSIGHKICQQLGYRSSRYSTSTHYLNISSSGYFQLVQNETNNLFQGNLKFSSNCTEKAVVAVSCSETTCGVWSVTNEDHNIHRKVSSYELQRQWPSVAFLENENNTICTASILSPLWVITAHSCLSKGDLAINESAWTLTAFNTRNLEAMEKEKISVESLVSGAYGIVLLKLASQLPFGHHTICLPDQEVAPNDLCIAAEWKQSNLSEAGEVLHYEQQLIVSSKHCTRNETENLICAGPVSQEESTFKAQAGAPLMCMSDDRWQLQGILTSNEVQQPEKQTLAYSSVFSIARWIYSEITTEKIFPEIV